MNLKDQLKPLVEGEVLDDNETLAKYSRDASLFEIKPAVVVLPKNSEDIKKLIHFVAEKNLGPSQGPKLSLTARAGGTDMTGGPLTESVVLDFTKYFNHVREVSGDYAIVEPGVYYRDFEKETLKKDLILPSYPASREICAIGGMVANNSGGEKSLKYGQTRRYVQQLKVVLHDGIEYIFRPLNREELEQKIKQDDFEGQIYRDTYQLITENLQLITSAKPQVSKNSAGYALWDVWHDEKFDLTQLFVGSQGTLGIITEVKFRLIKPKKHSKLLVVLLKDMSKLVEVVHRVLRFQPESFEFFDDHTMKLGIRYMFWRFAFKFLPELWLTITTGGLPKLALLAEFTGDSLEEIDKQMKAAQDSLKDLNVKSRITKDEADAQKYWTLRRESFNLLRTKIKDRKTAPFIDDIIVQPEKLPEFLPRLNAILDQYPKIIFTLAGHIGDGNIHVIPLVNFNDPEEKAAIPEIIKKVHDLIFEFKGSMTAEHNDGLTRSPFLAQMYGEKVYELFKKTKQIFDPDNIFNPGKKVGADFAYALEHLRK